MTNTSTSRAELLVRDAFAKVHGRWVQGMTPPPQNKGPVKLVSFCYFRCQYFSLYLISSHLSSHTGSLMSLSFAEFSPQFMRNRDHAVPHKVPTSPKRH
jgi:hypothetical protein